MLTFVATLAVATLAIAASSTARPSASNGALTVVAERATTPLAGPQTLYSHADCVGPGVGPLAPAHDAHSANVPGFTISTRPVRVATTFLVVLGAGPCPLTSAGPALAYDFSGTYSVSAVCRGTQDDDASFFASSAVVVAGNVVASTFVPGSCTGAPNAAFALDVTVDIEGIQEEGRAAPPAGGALLTISQ